VLGFDYSNNGRWQIGLAGSYRFSKRIGMQAVLSYAGFRPNRTTSHLHEIVDAYEVFFYFKEKAFQNVGLSVSGQAVLANIGKHHWPLMLQVGGTLRYLPVGSMNIDPDHGGVINLTTGDPDGNVGAGAAFYGVDTTVLTIRRVTPGVHVGLSLEGLAHDRMRVYIAADKDLMPYRQGNIGYDFIAPGQPKEDRDTHNTFYLETLSFGLGIRVW
jgi:hypothetical protein